MFKQNIPPVWVDATVMPTYKRKGTRSVPSIYRPIFLLNMIGELYSSALVGGLNKTVTTRLAETLYEFKKDYLTEQAILGVPTLIRISLDRRHPVDLVFVDIAKAFESLPHEAFFNLIQPLRAYENVHEEPKGTIQGTTQQFEL